MKIDLKTTEDGWTFTLSGTHYEMSPNSRGTWQLFSHGDWILDFASVSAAWDFISEMKHLDWMQRSAKA